jgi:hypothetical protein
LWRGGPTSGWHAGAWGWVTAPDGTREIVLEGPVGALLGDEGLVGPNDLIFKPRNQSDTFWTASDEPARILEIISPTGFERFFDELIDLGGLTQADAQALADLCARYEVEVDPESVPGVVERFEVRFPGEPIR